MREYTKPEIEITEFDIEDIVMASSGGPQTSIFVGGEEIQVESYGAQDFSIFDNTTQN